MKLILLLIRLRRHHRLHPRRPAHLQDGFQLPAQEVSPDPETRLYDTTLKKNKLYNLISLPGKSYNANSKDCSFPDVFQDLEPYHKPSQKFKAISEIMSREIFFWDVIRVGTHEEV